MNFKYPQEEFEDSIYQEFMKDCPETQLEPNTIRDFIKWAIIKGYLKQYKLVYRELPEYLRAMDRAERYKS